MSFTPFEGPAIVPHAAVNLTYGASVPVNAVTGNVYDLTLTGSGATLANPAGGRDGQVIRFRIEQGGSGSYTLAYGTAYDFGAAGSPTLSTTVGDIDILGFEYVAESAAWCFLGAALGN